MSDHALQAIDEEIKSLSDEKAAIAARREQIREELRDIEQRKKDLASEYHGNDARALEANNKINALERAKAVLIEHQPVAPAQADSEATPPPEPRRPRPQRPRTELDEGIESRRDLERQVGHDRVARPKPKPPLLPRRVEPVEPVHSTGVVMEREAGQERESAPRHSVAIDAPRTWKPGEKTSVECIEAVLMLLEDYGPSMQTTLVEGVKEVCGLKDGTAGGYVSGALLYLRRKGHVEFTGRQAGGNGWKLAEADGE